MKEKIHLRHLPAKKVLEEFLGGLEGPPTVIFNREEMRFERANDSRPLCDHCGEALVAVGSMYLCESERIYYEKSQLMKEKL
jgi:hypothetical protein